MSDSVLYVVSITQIPLAELGEERLASLSLQRPELAGNGSRAAASAIPGQARRNAWLFQSNPVLYDLRGALRTLKEQVWSLSRYAKEVRAGDRVYLWEAGRDGGIAGVAEIAEPARLQAEPLEQHPFARAPEAFAGDRIRTRLRVINVIDPVIPRQVIVSSPELTGLGVLRCSRGTNFRLSLDQWQALNSLIVGGAA